MHWRNSAERYGAAAMTAHWATAFFVVSAWMLGNFGHLLPRGLPRQDGFLAHMFLGLAVLLILVPRFLARLIDRPPAPEPTPAGAWGERMSILAHYALYVLLALVPILGILTEFARGHVLPFFGLFDISSPMTASRGLARSLRRFHVLSANAILILAGLHAFAAIVHHWILRDNTLRRMLPVNRPIRAKRPLVASVTPDGCQPEAIPLRQRRVSNMSRR